VNTIKKKKEPFLLFIDEYHDNPLKSGTKLYHTNIKCTLEKLLVVNL